MRTIKEIHKDIIACGQTKIPKNLLEEYKKAYFQITDGIPLDRLEQICNAEREGRLVVLPCKVGVYYPHGWYYVMQNTIYFVKGIDAMRPVVKCGIRKFYSTQEEAEAALREGK